MKQAIAIIPARMGSTRLPGKALLDRTGIPLVCHVAERAGQAERLSGVIIATDDQRIVDAAAAHGIQAALTSAEHPNGTSRIAEVAEGLPAGFDVIVNVQGDEPEIDPQLIDRVIDRLTKGDEPMATLVGPFDESEDPTRPEIVKVVVDQRGRAMYFSRRLIPFDRDDRGIVPLKHAGLYVYRREFLSRYVRLPATPAEQAEQLEQLRALEHGYPIAVVVAPYRHSGIDTPDQYDAFVQRHARQRHQAGP
jgi:3-deoxy-manno-octulosonate cytidylyltransferase (CMP-KDO synthetase)